MMVAIIDLLLVFFRYFLTMASSKGSVTNIWSFFLYYWAQSSSLHLRPVPCTAVSSSVNF